jgi:hypothetical protein
MSQPPPPNYYPPIDEKIPEELHQHLRLLYDRLQNHFTAIGNQQAQIKELQSQVATLQGK